MNALLRRLFALARARRQAVLVASALAVLLLLGWALLVERSLALAGSIALQVLVLLGLFLLRRQLAAQGRELRRARTAVSEVAAAIGSTRAAGSPLGRLLDDSASIARSLGVMRLDDAARHHELSEHLDASLQQLGQLRGGLDDASKALHDDLFTTGQQHPADTAAIVNLHRLVAVKDEMPLPGGWAVGPPTLLALVREVLSRPDHPTVVECGSGTSTVWIALALRERGGGRVIALEHAERYADQTRDDLARAGLSEWADVRLAPIEDQQVEEERQPWYAIHAWQNLADIDLLVVDGPPGSIAPQSRFPALPLLAHALRNGATVVLDDVGRPSEAQVAERWRALDSGVRLEDLRLVDRSMFFCATRIVNEPR